MSRVGKVAGINCCGKSLRDLATFREGAKFIETGAGHSGTGLAYQV